MMVVKRRITITKKQWRDAIKKGRCQEMTIAKLLGIDRHTVANKKKANPWLAQMFLDIKESQLNTMETTFLEAAEKNPKWALEYLDRFGKDRGWGKQVKVETDPNDDIQVVHHYINDGRNPYNPGEQPPDPPNDANDGKDS